MLGAPRGLTIKICGVRSVDDARLALDAGADAIGLNFVPGRARAIELETAEAIVHAVGTQLSVVGVVADPSDDLLASLAPLGLAAIQLHGAESVERCVELTARDPDQGTAVFFKAVSVRGRGDIEAAGLYPGPHVLFDAAAAPGQPAGGTGHGFDWSWLDRAGSRPYWLAGGLRPDNVGEAVRRSAAVGIDVASGVERVVGVKDAAKVAAFVEAARHAFTRRA